MIGMIDIIVEHDTELELTFAEIPFSEVQSAQANQSLIFINVAVVCSKTNLVLCVAEVELDTDQLENTAKINLRRKSWICNNIREAQIRLRLKKLFSELSRHDRYTYYDR